MPKDKKSKEGKKEGPSQEVEVVVKRKNSIVDSSGGSSSSSSASSDNSGTSSEHGSQAGDSDAFVAGFVSDNEKGTMTNDSQEGTSSSTACTSSSVAMQHVSMEINDRTAEFHSMNGHKEQPVTFVTDEYGIPIHDSTHFKPIAPSDVPTTSAASQSITNGNKKNGKPITRGGCKPKQLTKKQKKEQELREKEISGVPTTYPGQRESQRKAAPMHYVCPDDENLAMHHFDDSDGVVDGKALIRGTNAAAQAMLKTDTEVAIPFLRNEEELGKRMQFVDLHKNAQMRYLRFTTGIGAYLDLQPRIKLLHRMGYGIAASGIPDKQPLTLTINGAKHFMKHEYTDYVADGYKILNWRAEFESQADMDRCKRAEESEIWQKKLTAKLDEIIDLTTNLWWKKTLITIRDMDLRQVLLRFGEIERCLARSEAKCDKRFAELDKVAFANRSRPDRMKYLVSQMLECGSQRYEEKFDETDIEIRHFNILMHLASTAKGEKPCHEQRHRKCTILHYFLSQSGDQKANWLKQKFSGGNTLLHFAAMTGWPCQIDVLLRQGAPLNELNDMYKSPVGLALRRHQSLVARQLMWHGADIGGAFSVKHIAPRTNREEVNKQHGDYEDHIASNVPYKARDFMNSRHRALNMTFCSWLEAILIDSEARLRLGVGNLKSSLHQVRIGPDVFDSAIDVMGRVYLEKKLRISVDSSTGTEEPVVLFLIPCQYTRFDTTMGPHTPHIVRTHMLTDALAVSQRIAEKEKKRMAAGENRVEYIDDIKGCRPVRVLGAPVAICNGDSCSSRGEPLESFFSYEHNGVLYGYTLPRSVTHNSSQYTNIVLSIMIPESESHRFKDVFFMVQAVQVVKLEAPKPLDPSMFSSDAKYDAERAQNIATKVAKRKQEILCATDGSQNANIIEEDDTKSTVSMASRRTTESTCATVSATNSVNDDSPKKPKSE